MVGHHDEGIQFNLGIVPGHSHPRLVDQAPVCVESHLIVYNLAEQACAMVRADGHKIGPLLGIVETTQTDGAARRLVGVVACVHIFKRSAGPAILCTGGFETRPYVCLFGTRRGGRGLFAGSTVGIGLWGAVGGTEGATSPWAVLLVRARAGFKPAPTSASSGRGVGGRASLRVPGGDWLVGGGWWDRGGRLRLGLFCWYGRGRV